jgi:hypothetical protein
MFLRKQQGVLIEQLRRRSAEIADMYYGGLCSFADEKNPFRLPLAAHAFREVIAHCARLTGESVVFGAEKPAQARQERHSRRKQTTRVVAAGSVSRYRRLSEDLRDALEAFSIGRSTARERKEMALMLAQLVVRPRPCPQMSSRARSLPDGGA